MQTNDFSQGNIYLMGFMGCGKSYVGKLLSERLKWSFIDTDECIVQEAGMSIPEIFEKQGEPAFRKLEKSCVDRVSKLKEHVISLGGGAILDQDNWKNISQSGITVTLSYPAEILASRLVEKSDRPLLNQTEGDKRLHRISDLLKKRKPYYQKADLIMHLNKEVDAERVANALLGFVRGDL